MKTIKLDDVEIKLNIGEELKVRELRKLQPIISSRWTGEEIEMVIDVLKAFAEDDDIEKKVDDLNIEQFQKLSEELTGMLDVKKKING